MNKWAYPIIMFIAIALSACGGGGGGNPANTNNNDDGGNNGGNNTVKTGTFVDSQVAGVSYSTSSGLTGTTNTDGEFSYRDGDTVTFLIGDLSLGTADAVEILTPIDFVNNANASTAEVNNIVRLLIGLDSDGDPSNGILITEAMLSAAMGQSIDFAATNDTELGSLLTTVAGAEQALPTVEEAESHLTDSVYATRAGVYTGSYSGTSSGAWQVSVNAVGKITGTVFNGTEPVGSIEGTASTGDDVVMGVVGSTISFTGGLDGNGILSGTWADSETGDNGTFTGSKQKLVSLAGTYHVNYTSSDESISGEAVAVVDRDNSISIKFEIPGPGNNTQTATGTISENGQTISADPLSVTFSPIKFNGVFTGEWQLTGTPAGTVSGTLEGKRVSLSRANLAAVTFPLTSSASQLINCSGIWNGTSAGGDWSGTFNQLTGELYIDNITNTAVTMVVTGAAKTTGKFTSILNTNIEGILNPVGTYNWAVDVDGNISGTWTMDDSSDNGTASGSCSGGGAIPDPEPPI